LVIVGLNLATQGAVRKARATLVARLIPSITLGRVGYSVVRTSIHDPLPELRSSDPAVIQLPELYPPVSIPCVADQAAILTEPKKNYFGEEVPTVESKDWRH
jgi:hypothetical protein